jgi:outer membrane lipoprotein LolB
VNPLLKSCAALCAVILSACATVAPPRALIVAPSFELAGRIVVRYQQQGFSSSLRWKLAGGRDDLWLTAPLGQTIAHLEADADGATLTAPDQRTYRANSIESLTKSAFGWRFPVDGMRYWVFGEAVPGALPAASERDEARRITRLKHDDWQVVFTYATVAATRPSRIDVTGNDAEIRLAIDNATRDAP